MFIENRNDKIPKLRRSGIFRTGIALLRSVRIFSNLRFYKYLVPPGLIPLGIALIICTLSVINSRAHVDATEPQSAQEQMQFPEGLDYSKFQHSSRNHSRLPC